MKNLSRAFVLSLICIASSAQVTSADVDKEHLLRRIRFGERELHLPQQLENDELVLTNDKLEVQIAKLEYREPDTDRVLIDQYVVEQSKAAIRDATIFAQMYHLTNSPAQDLVELDAKLDGADKACHARDDEESRVTFTSMAEAQAACSDLEELSSAVASHHIATPQGWISVFAEDPARRTRTGYKLFLADTEQLKKDEVSHLDPKATRLLISSDRSLFLDDKQIWLTEMSEQETIEFNTKHPEHPMGDMSDILATLVKFRADLARINNKYREDISKVSQPKSRVHSH